MKRLLLGIVILLGTFAIGVAGNHLFNRVYLRFENTAVGSMVYPPTGRGGFSDFRSRDGVDLNFEHFDFPSHEAAQVAFQNELKTAERIVEREVLRNRTGEPVVGEKVVAMYRTKDGREYATVISLDGTKLYEIRSTSLRHAVSFERAHRRY